MAEYDVKSGASFGTSLDSFNLLPAAGSIVDTAKFDGVLVSTTGVIIQGATVSPGDGASLTLQHSNSDTPATFTDVPADEINGSLPGPYDLISTGTTARSLVGYLGKKRYLRVNFLDSVNGDMMWAGGVNIILLKGESTP